MSASSRKSRGPCPREARPEVPGDVAAGRKRAEAPSRRGTITRRQLAQKFSSGGASLGGTARPPAAREASPPSGGSGRYPEEACLTTLGECTRDALWPCCRQVILLRLPSSFNSTLSTTRPQQINADDLSSCINRQDFVAKERPGLPTASSAKVTRRERAIFVAGAGGGDTASVTHRRFHASLQ